MKSNHYIPTRYEALHDRRRHHSIAIIIAFYYFVQPHMPTYNVENLDVKSFDLQINNNLHTNINVVMKAVNPNADIGLDYLENEVSITYSGTVISVGQFQPFLQKGKETTIFNMTLKGDSDFDPIMQNKLLLDQNLGHIPLLIMVKVPVRILIDDLLHLRKFVVHVNCSLVIDQLKQNKKPNILKKDFTYDIHM
ncbi:unnamed protein product [Vicia faba]|uniref:Late embryogenesis abundant protein LEA-2 subgroup domain-containing protein n=1 Tax=Vicia faba TaxID=3906 RepID=A0AAV0Z9H7_VICFA|nr:unnamed protein product [Vicia faba]